MLPLFYSLLAEKGGFPKTSQAAPQVILDLYEDAKRCGDEVVHLTLSSAISGTYQTARAMRDEVEYEGIHVVDSKNATGGQRMLVQYAAKLRDEGKSAKEIADIVLAEREHVQLYALLDPLEYLEKGGRISKTAAFAGTLLSLKPMLCIKEGALASMGKARGMKQGHQMLMKELIAADIDFEHCVWQCISYDALKFDYVVFCQV